MSEKAASPETYRTSRGSDSPFDGTTKRKASPPSLEHDVGRDWQVSKVSKRVTRSRATTVKSFIKREDINKGNIQCPVCSVVICVSERGCNVITCRNHQPQFVYFCAHCKAVTENNVEYATCDCPKRNTRQTRAEAQAERNLRAEENPILLDDSDSEEEISLVVVSAAELIAQAQAERNLRAENNPISLEDSDSDLEIVIVSAKNQLQDEAMNSIQKQESKKVTGAAYKVKPLNEKARHASLKGSKTSKHKTTESLIQQKESMNKWLGITDPVSRQREFMKKWLNTAPDNTPHLESDTGTGAPLLDLAILQGNTTTFCNVSDLKSMRATCQIFKKAADQDMDRRIDQEIIPHGGVLFNRGRKKQHWKTTPHILKRKNVVTLNDYPNAHLSLGWDERFSATEGLKRFALPFCHFLIREFGNDALFENRERLKRRFLEDGEMAHLDFRVKDTGPRGGMKGQADWTVRIEKPKVVEGSFAAEIVRTVFEPPMEFSDNKERLRVYIWMLLCRSATLKYSLVSMVNQGKSCWTDGHEFKHVHSLMFRTIDGRELDMIREIDNWEEDYRSSVLES